MVSLQKLGIFKLFNKPTNSTYIHMCVYRVNLRRCIHFSQIIVLTHKHAPSLPIYITHNNYKAHAFLHYAIQLISTSTSCNTQHIFNSHTSSPGATSHPLAALGPPHTPTGSPGATSHTHWQPWGHLTHPLAALGPPHTPTSSPGATSHTP